MTAPNAVPDRYSRSGTGVLTSRETRTANHGTRYRRCRIAHHRRTRKSLEDIREIGTNLPFSEWGSVFPDPRLVAAIVDRVSFSAHILETGTESCRLRTSKNSSRRKRAS